MVKQEERCEKNREEKYSIKDGLINKRNYSILKKINDACCHDANNSCIYARHDILDPAELLDIFPERIEKYHQ